MSKTKRNRLESDGQVLADDEKDGALASLQQRIQLLEQTLQDKERKSANLQSFQIHKLREPPGLEIFQQSYTDPLVHFELLGLKERVNKMIKQLFEQQQELDRREIKLGKDTLVEEINALKKNLLSAKEESNRISMELLDANNFIEMLKVEVIDAKKARIVAEAENQRLSSQLFAWQQQSQHQQSLAAAPAEEVNHQAEGDSPVLALDED